MGMDEVIPREESVQVLHLANGVKTYIQGNGNPPQCGSFRVIICKSPCENVQYSFDGKLDSCDTLEQFFTYCKQKALKSAFGNEQLLHSPSSLPCDFPSLDRPSEIAVIAVGDFQVQEMKSLIEKHFSKVILEEREEYRDGSSGIQVGYDAELPKVAVGVCYPSTCKSVNTYKDLKECWKLLMLQELFQQRMERCSREFEEIWVHPHPRFFYPVKGYSLASEESLENLLCCLLWQVEMIRNGGFFEDEFCATKRKTLNQLQYLSCNAIQPDDAFLASYYADQFFLADKCLKHQNFLDASVNLVQQIHSEDLLPYLPSFLLDENRQIQLVYPMPNHSEVLTGQRIEELVNHIASLADFYRNSEIEEDPFWTLEVSNATPFSKHRKSSLEEACDFIQLVSDDKQEEASFCMADSMVSVDQLQEDTAKSFYQLPLNEKERRLIRAIISTMAEKNVIELVFEKHSLEKKGDKIRKVHPLRFIGYIISNSDLRNNLRIIKKSSFKWDAFVSGFAKRMREELSNDNVYCHVPGFANQVSFSQENINHYIRKKDFEGLIKSLL
jgi:hypothetical protein